MRKGLFLAIIVILLVSGVSWAGGGGQSGTSSGSQKTLLSFWSGMPEEMGPRQAMEAYTKLHPNIEFEFVKLGWDDASNTRLDTALMSGVGVDVATPTRGEVEKAQRGLVLDLTDELRKRNIDPIRDVGEDFKDLMVDGKYFSLPLARLAVMWFLNKDMFDKAGIPIPKAGWTIDDMRDISRRLTTREAYGVYFTHNWPLSWIGSIPNGYINRLDIFTDAARRASNLKDPRFVESLELVTQMTFNDKSMLPYAEALSENYTPSSVLYTGKAAMVVSASYVLRDARDLQTFPHTFKVAIAPPPIRNKNQREIMDTFALSDLIQVSAKTPNKDAAIDFAFWLHNEGVKYFIPYGRLPAHEKISSQEVLDAFLRGPQSELYDEASLRAFFETPFIKTPELFGAYEITQIIVQEASPALVGEISPQQAIDNADRRVTEYLRNR